jgi:hypothetical protein
VTERTRGVTRGSVACPPRAGPVVSALPESAVAAECRRGGTETTVADTVPMTLVTKV